MLELLALDRFAVISLSDCYAAKDDPEKQSGNHKYSSNQMKRRNVLLGHICFSFY